MCLLYTRIDGVKYNLQQMRAMYENTCEENAYLNDELAKREKKVLGAKLGTPTCGRVGPLRFCSYPI